MTLHRHDLAAALRRARERLRPDDVGLPAGRQRRVPGLRREEVAHLAGISVDYVVRLEQARGPHPSAQVMGALARALRLDDDERDHLFSLADLPLPRAGQIDVHVRPSVMRLMDRFVDLPVLVRSAKADVLAWNDLAAALLGDFSAVPPARRNVLRLRYLPHPADPPRSRRAGSVEEQAAVDAHAVADLRAAAGRYPDDPGLRRLVADLVAGSSAFRELWERGEAGPIRSMVKTMVHPVVGEVRFDCDSFHVPDSDQTLVVYSAAPGTPDADALALLRVVGTQRLSTRAVATRP